MLHCTIIISLCVYFVQVLGLGSKQQQTAALQELVITQQISLASKASAADMQQPHHPQHINATASTAAGETSSTGDSTSSISTTAASPGGMAINSSSGLGKHLVHLLDALLVQQQQSQHVSKQRPRQIAREPIKPEGLQGSTAAAPSAAAAVVLPQLQQQPQQLQIDKTAIHDAVTDANSASAVVLVLPQLHQSLSWVLHFMNQRYDCMALSVCSCKTACFLHCSPSSVVPALLYHQREFVHPQCCRLPVSTQGFHTAAQAGHHT